MPVESGRNNPSMERPCRDCKFSGGFGGEAAESGGLRPYNDRLAFKALENIERLLGVLCTLLENIGVPAGVEFKSGGGFPNSGECRLPRECPMEWMYQKPGGYGGGSGVGGKVEE